MYKYVLGVLVIMSLGLSSCFKKDVCNEIDAPLPSDAEISSLTQFVNSLDADAVYDARGFYYRIVKPGSANHPGICSDLLTSFECTNGANTVYYSGASNSPAIDLSNQNYAWRFAYPMIGMGGEIIIYVPPTLREGYSTLKARFHASGNIPVDANVMYRLTLKRWN